MKHYTEFLKKLHLRIDSNWSYDWYHWSRPRLDTCTNSVGRLYCLPVQLLKSTHCLFHEENHNMKAMMRDVAANIWSFEFRIQRPFHCFALMCRLRQTSMHKQESTMHTPHLVQMTKFASGPGTSQSRLVCIPNKNGSNSHNATNAVVCPTEKEMRWSLTIGQILNLLSPHSPYTHTSPHKTASVGWSFRDGLLK